VNKFILAIATGLGTGYMKPASGTWGTLPGVALAVFFSALSPFNYLVCTVGLLFIGAWAATAAEAHFGKKDAGQIVIDEVVGYLVTMFLIPVTFWNIVWAFFLFRFFDIVKFWPARQIDRAKSGGWSVMLDDVAAGIYANIALQLLVALGWFGCGWN